MQPTPAMLIKFKLRSNGVAGTERYSHRYLANVLTVSLGVGLASYGELNFNVTGTLLQLGALILDALRCQRLQMVRVCRGA